MKELIRKILFKKGPAEFFGVHLNQEQIGERVVLIQANGETDISLSHCIVCQEPFCIAVWFHPAEAGKYEAKQFDMEIRKGNTKMATLRLRPQKEVQAGNTTILILKIEKAVCHQVGNFRQYFFYHYISPTKKLSLEARKTYGALYSYPRNIIIVSYKEEGYYNIFPMDFQGIIEGANRVVLGLRTTNITLDKILHSRRLVIGDTEGATLATVYELGKHHSSRPPLPGQLPFETSGTALFGFPLPRFSASYMEIEVEENYLLGSHMMILGKIMHKKLGSPSGAVWHHVHQFEFCTSAYKEVVA